MKYVAVAAALLIAGCSGQEPATPEAQNETAAANVTKPKPVRSKSPEEAFADAVAANDAYSGAAGRLAEAKGSTPAVKALGKLVVDTHNRSTMELKYAGKDVAGFFVDPSLSDEQAANIKALEAATGPAFDAAFKAQQIAAQTTVLATLEKYRTAGTEMPLKTYAYLIQPKIKAELAKAKAL